MFLDPKNPTVLQIKMILDQDLEDLQEGFRSVSTINGHGIGMVGA